MYLHTSEPTHRIPTEQNTNLETTAQNVQTAIHAARTPEKTPSSHTYYCDTSDPLKRAAPNAKYGETSELRAMTPQNTLNLCLYTPATHLPGYSAATDLLSFLCVNVDDESSTSNRSIPWNILVSYSSHLLNLMMACE